MTQAATAEERLHIREWLARFRASPPRGSPRAAARFSRQCEVVERYDVRGESRRSICEELHISESAFYLDRRALLAKIGRSAPSARVRNAITSALDARFREAELLAQLGADDLATERLNEIAKNAPSEEARILALARLAEAECRFNRVDAALSALRHARERFRFGDVRYSMPARGALLSAEAACAFVRRDPQTLERTARELEDLAAGGDSRACSQAAAACARVSYYWYIRQELAASDAACKRSEAALEVVGDACADQRATVLALRAEIDRYDPDRVHRAGAKDAAAYALAANNGLVKSAGVALYNTLIWLLYSDEPIGKTHASFVTELAHAACQLVLPSDGPILPAVALGALERYDEAIALLVRSAHREDALDWGAANRILHARLLFKARRFSEAVRVAQAALEDATPSGAGLKGRALRIQAEAFEALGRRREASRAIGDALDALKPCAPIHHLLAAYRCGARLSPRRPYRDEIGSLSQAMCKESPLAHWAEALTQSSARAANPDSLSRRQREIGLLVAEGKTNAAIARNLGLSKKTVANHVAAIFERLGLRARWQLTRAIIAR